MPSSESITVDVAPLPQLSDAEAYAYRVFLSNGQKNGQAPLGEELSHQLLALFQQGKSCDEIRRLRPGIGLGQIVHARIRDRWDTKRVESLQALRENSPDLAERAQLESVEFIAKMLSVAHRKHEKALNQFLADGNEAHLAGTPFETMSVRTYQTLLDMLAKATGQDQKKTVKVTGGITVTAINPTKIAPAVAAAALESMS